ncbi:hypothetical protein PanWU01x14_368380, partial [Parasponia andersonii]
QGKAWQHVCPQVSDRITVKDRAKLTTGSEEEYAVLASKTPFSVSEIESLYELLMKRSSSVLQYGLEDK